jgi:hypothetical protein
MARLAYLLLFVLFAQSAAAEPVKVSTGAFVTSISGINIADGSFRIAGVLWIVDPSGGFDAIQSLEILGRNSETRLIERQLLPDGMVYTLIAFEAELDKHFDTRNFPFDAHSLKVAMETDRDSTEFQFVPDLEDSGIANTVQLPRFNVGELHLSAADESYDSGFGLGGPRSSFSRLTLSVEVSRIRSTVILEKFTGFFLALMIAGLVLAVPVNQLGTRLGVLTSAIFAAVLNQYRLVDAMAFDGVFGLVDQIALVTFLLILSVLALSIYAEHVDRTQTPRAGFLANWRIGAVVMVIHAVLLITAFALAL